MTKKILFFFLIIASLNAEPPTLFLDSAQEHKIVRRAAFDIGSGKISVQVSDVDLTINKIVNVLFTRFARVHLREDLVKSLEGRFSDEACHQTVRAIQELMEKIAPFQAEAYHAIATESLRLAKNGDALAQQIEKETGIPVTIVSQEEEGILGFISAVNEATVDPDEAISWDFGGGSFQITTKCKEGYCIYQGRLGKIPLKIALLDIQGKGADQTLTPNPISKSHAFEAFQFIKDNLNDVPYELIQKLNSPNVMVLAVGINPLWGMKQCFHFDKLRIFEELESRLNLDDEAIRIKDAMPMDRWDAAVYVASNLILAYGIMDALGINHVQYVGTESANAIGVLLSPHYWEDAPTQRVNP